MPSTIAKQAFNFCSDKILEAVFDAATQIRRHFGETGDCERRAQGRGPLLQLRNGRRSPPDGPVIIETQFDLLSVKAAVNGARRAMRHSGREVPLQTQVTIELTGRMLPGTEIGGLGGTLGGVLGRGERRGELVALRGALRRLGDRAAQRQVPVDVVECVLDGAGDLAGVDAEGDAEPVVENASLDCGWGQLLEVNALEDGASPYGLLNTLGNAWEWVGDEPTSARPYHQIKGGAYGYSEQYNRLDNVSFDQPGAT